MATSEKVHEVELIEVGCIRGALLGWCEVTKFVTVCMRVCVGGRRVPLTTTWKDSSPGVNFDGCPKINPPILITRVPSSTLQANDRRGVL
eukprot:scaffold135480_cov18-Tisochrysis_lutea.AAC.1